MFMFMFQSTVAANARLRTAAVVVSTPLLIIMVHPTTKGSSNVQFKVQLY